MCGSVVLIARDVPAAPVGERFRAVTRARGALRGLIARTLVLPICDFPERARSVAPVCGRGALTAMVTGYYPVAPTAALLFAVLGSAMLVREFWPASRGMHRAATAAGLFGAAVAGVHACLAKQDMYTQLLPVLRQQIKG